MILEEILLLGKPQQILKKFAKQRLDGHCIYCGYESDNLTADHIKPRCRSGPTAHHNLAPACLDCNRSKGSKDVWDWWQRSYHWHDAVESGRVAILKSILDDRRSQADFFLGILEQSPNFRLAIDRAGKTAMRA
jgi:hypothetical protein